MRGDLIGVDILERGAGKAIDELVVELPHENLLPLMVNEVNEVDGVDVEDIRQVPGAPVDPRLDALETAAYLVERQKPADLLGALVAHAARDFEADWAAVIDPSAPHPLNSVGSMPPEAWVFAFVKGPGIGGRQGRGGQPGRCGLGRPGRSLAGGRAGPRRASVPDQRTTTALGAGPYRRQPLGRDRHQGEHADRGPSCPSRRPHRTTAGGAGRERRGGRFLVGAGGGPSGQNAGAGRVRGGRVARGAVLL